MLPEKPAAAKAASSPVSGHRSPSHRLTRETHAVGGDSDLALSLSLSLYAIVATPTRSRARTRDEVEVEVEIEVEIEVEVGSLTRGPPTTARTPRPRRQHDQRTQKQQC